jgi:hypothetical protein
MVKGKLHHITGSAAVARQSEKRAAAAWSYMTIPRRRKELEGGQSILTLYEWGYIWGYSCEDELLDIMLISFAPNYSVAVRH